MTRDERPRTPELRLVAELWPQRALGWLIPDGVFASWHRRISVSLIVGAVGSAVPGGTRVPPRCSRSLLRRTFRCRAQLNKQRDGAGRWSVP